MAIIDRDPIATTSLEAVAEIAMPPVDSFEAELLLSMHAMADMVRERVASGLSNWQELPLLAMRANGKDGRYEHDLSLLSTHGVYRIDDDPAYPINTPYKTPGLYGYFIDCSDASIIRLKGDPAALGDIETVVPDKELAAVIGKKVSQQRLGDFSATAVRAGLQAIIKEPDSSNRSAEEASRLAHIEREVARHYLRSIRSI